MGLLGCGVLTKCLNFTEEILLESYNISCHFRQIRPSDKVLEKCPGRLIQAVRE